MEDNKAIFKQEYDSEWISENANWNELIGECSKRMNESIMTDLAKSKQEWLKNTFDWDLSLDEVKKMMDAQYLVAQTEE